MSVSFSLRAMTPEDSAALAALTAQSPDGGNITFSPRFHISAYEAFRAQRPDMLGVVAEAKPASGLVGAMRISFGECQFEGAVRPYALLSSLIVHPDYRRQGIASAMTKWCMERATERQGSDTVIFGDIQTGNAGSTANARKWFNEINGHIVTSPVPMNSKPPKRVSGITVRPIAPDDLDSFAEHLNMFYQDYNFHQRQTAGSLSEWLQATPFTTPIHHLLIATDSAGRLLAGMSISEQCRLTSLYVENLPIPVRIANLFLKIIPHDGEMRNLQADQLWFAPGQLQAARHLWQTARWEWRDRGSSLLYNFDPRSPIREVLQNPFWLPTTSVSIALRAPVSMSATRLIAPIV